VIRLVFSKLSSFGCFWFCLLPACKLHSMDLCLVSSCSILSTILYFPYYCCLIVCYFLILYVFAVAPYLFLVFRSLISFSQGLQSFPFNSKILCPPRDRHLRCHFICGPSNFKIFVERECYSNMKIFCGIFCRLFL